MTYLEAALGEGQIKFEKSDRGLEYVRYVAVDRRERWSDPEERVRAEYYAELIHRYGYSPKRIGVEVTVPDRSPNDFADLVVFHDDERKRPFAVIECKAESYGGKPIAAAIFNQAVEQAWGNGNAHKFRAAYVGVVAGATRRFLDCAEKFGALERDGNQVADLPVNYGKPPPYKFVKGGIDGKRDITAVEKGDLIAAIDKTHQTLWGGGRLSPPAAFGEFCKLIFVKVRDEKRVAESDDGTVYDFQINTDETAVDLGARIRKLYDAEMEREKDVFTERLKIDDLTIKMCVEHLESINFSATDLDTKGVAFERFLDGFFKGDFGQYFTPREIIQFCVAMMPPQANDYVLDTSCGSGGFLLYAMDHVRHQAAGIKDEVLRFRKWHDFAEKRLFGIEINDEISRVAKMNMILHDDGHTNVVAADGLESWPVLEKINRDLRPEAFDIILTNPPFGAVVKAAEKGQAYIDRFDLSRHLGKTASGDGEKQKAGKAAVKQRASVKTEILFLERIHDFLKPGTGRAAIVVPDGILTNGSLQGVRDWVMERFQILAVISLPQAAFQHSGASVKASLLFVRRRGAKEVADDNEAIFMAAPANIGYDTTGRDTVRIEVIKPGDDERRVRKHHDLFAYEAVEAFKDGKWEEAGPRAVLPHEGVLGAWSRFQKDPQSFFV
jgi:type I restriction enzyme M protein